MFKKKSTNKLSLGVFFAFLIFLGSILFLIPYQTNPDTWYHVKAGEIFLKNGLLFHDIFSISAQTRPWYPYEWLFQVGIYLFQNAFGFSAIKLLIIAFALFQVSIIYLLCKKIFNLNNFFCIVISFFYFSWTSLFLQGRPYLVINTFFLINLFLILLYFLKNKNLLWLTIPLTWIWTNIHGSIFIDIFLLGAYFGIACINFFITKKTEWKKKSLVLGLYTIISVILTVLPPLYLTQYRVLLLFYSKLSFFQQIFDDYTQTIYSLPIFLFIACMSAIVLTLFYKINKAKGTLKESLWIFPLFILIIFSFSAMRNTFFAYSALSILLALILSQINPSYFKQKNKIILNLILIVFTLINIVGFYIQSSSNVLKPPENAVKFIKENNIKGNMFNQLTYGGYLIYYLYPEHKVFIDLRAEVYLCCELPDYYSSVIKTKYLPDFEYKKSLDNLWNKYNISYALLDTRPNTVQERIGRILANDPSWNLVFWDDDWQIFVKKDGKNNTLLSKYYTKSASPYSTIPYKGSDLQLAIYEYEKMIKIADSAKSRNALGYIYFKQGKVSNAKNQFEKAISLDKSFDSPYMNLGEINLLNNDPQNTANLYQKALEVNPDRAYTYVRLGQIYLQYLNDPIKAKEIWTEGQQRIQETTAQAEFKQLLQSNY